MRGPDWPATGLLPGTPERFVWIELIVVRRLSGEQRRSLAFLVQAVERFNRAIW